MPNTVVLPSLGESIVEAVIERWLKKPGDSVNKYDSLAEVITDKVNSEVPSPVAGQLVEILAQPGQRVNVGAPICTIAVEGEVVAPNPPAPTPMATSAALATPPSAPSSEPPAPPTSGIVMPKLTTIPPSDPSEPPTVGIVMPKLTTISPPEPPAVSPSVQALAVERGVDLAKVKGTGIGGRITRRDVLSAVEEQERAHAGATPPAEPIANAATTPPPPPAPTLSAPTPAVEQSPTESERVPLSGIRRIIADQMTKSKTTIPHAWQVQEIDMSRIATFRNRVKEEFRRREGVNLTYVPFVIKAACEALRDNPLVNSSFDGDGIIVHRDLNIGVAVGTDDALYVPVIKRADSLSLAGIARALADLTDRARRGKLTVPDMQGATFTVNNVGTFGTVISYSIINPPQAAILTMEAVVDRVVVVDGMIAIRPMMFLCFSFDHRIIDGLLAGRFLSGVRRRLETFDPDTALLY